MAAEHAEPVLEEGDVGVVDTLQRGDPPEYGAALLAKIFIIDDLEQILVADRC